MQGHLLLVALLFMGMFYNIGAPGTLDRMEESIFILLMTLNIDELLRLELTSAKHASGLFQAVDNNRQHLSEFLTWVDKTKTINDIGNHIKACELLNGERKEVNYTIVYDDVVVGRIGLHHINLLHKNASIGYWIAKDFEGKGIMLRSCTALIIMASGN